MGQALISAAQWTSAKDGSKGKLELTPLNEELLNTILKFVEGFSSKSPEEAKLVFKKPLSWETTLSATQFGGSSLKEVEGSLISDEKKDDVPLFSLQGQTISIMTLENAETVLRAAGDKKITELRLCLEANRDPVINMLGERFGTVQGDDNSIMRYIEEIRKEMDQSAQTSQGGETSEQQLQEIRAKKIVLSLRLKLFNLDQQLLNQSIKKMSTQQRLTPGMVDAELTLLRDLSGHDDERHVLQHIDYYGQTFVFKNGCRAQPWRQVHGDICYIEARPHDVDTVLYITAHTSGFYLNKGPDPEKPGQLILDRADEDIHRDLVTLLKAKSSKFTELINKQEFAMYEEHKHDHRYDIGTDEEDGEPTARSDQQTWMQKEKGQDEKDKHGKQRQNAKKKPEPSLKWKALGMEEYKEEQHVRPKDKEKKAKNKGSPHLYRRKTKTPLEPADSFSESSTESEEEEEAIDRRSEANADLPSEYWQIQKLVKYLKGGNQTATIIALCSLRDFNLTQETCQLAIRDVGGLEVLINLLDTEEVKCKIGALKILKEISRNTQIRRSIADLGGLQTMVKILRDPDKDLKCLAAETIANVAKFRRARRTVRQHGGIKRLVSLLDCVALTSSHMTPEMEQDVEVARCGALALWSCSKSKKNKEAMQRAGAIPLLARLLKSPHENMLIPVVGTLQECASEPSYRLAIRTEGMIEDLVKNLKSRDHDQARKPSDDDKKGDAKKGTDAKGAGAKKDDKKEAPKATKPESVGKPNPELQMHCASAIFKCAEEKETRDLVRQFGGLDPLVHLLTNMENKELLAAATGAIWKCAISPENVARFQELKAIDQLVALLANQPEEVLVNVVGALGELAKAPPNRAQIRKCGGIPNLVNLLTGTNQALLVNVTKAVGQCAAEPENMVIIDKLDGVRLLWSLLKNQNPEVQASAAWAICPCIENAKDAGEMVRSFVGGLELIVSLLKSEDKEVLAAVCAAIANIAKDEENLAVITDHGVVPMLARLTSATDDKLRQHLAEAISRCCNWGNNRTAFGKEGAVAPLVRYLKSKDEDVHRSTARALFQLSKNPDNCITMHEAGVVQPLLKMVGSEDEDVQESSAGCIGNIRRLALANERAKFA
ncbi:armadillo repeat-containing protein 4-like isoform X2 [Pomacea canaliculata]|uniref:armadillo repeat-containing protein 4-like isoform X2 n=1 Tax=Pomacea canaliculata TaxID=400727 RepID=UPI000D73B930|nr:armadillo repeat-containing protein 4-like isoform X2 [Pomacea canaliculata]